MQNAIDAPNDPEEDLGVARPTVQAARNPHRRGWHGWRKHVARGLRRLKPDDLTSWIGVWVLLAVGLTGMYVAGTPGVFAAVVLMALVAFVIGVARWGVSWVVRVTRSRLEEP
jgi:hypothetical protein